MADSKSENSGSLDGVSRLDGVKDESESAIRAKDIRPMLSESESLQADQFDFIRFTVADIHGIPRSKSVSRPNFRQFLKTGTTFCSVTVGMGTRSELVQHPDVVSIGFPNCPAVPMPGTLHKLPWATGGQHKVGEVLCETFWTEPYRDVEGPQEVCPRYIARRQLERLGEMGYELYSGFEAEFGVYDVDTSMPVFHGNNICNSLVTARFESFLYDVDLKLREAGVNCGPMNLEWGYGQFEIAMMPCRGIRTADAMFWLKEGVKEIGQQRKMKVTFMSRPYPEAFNSGLHFSHSLWTKDTNLNAFQIPAGPSGRVELSDIARGWIAGLVKHSKALTALCSPTVNCYRRLHAPWSPDRADWGMGTRNVAFRFKLENSPEGTYLENRIPSGAANPYLVMAATVAAGIDGIRNNITPVSKDSTPAPNDSGAELLPNSLEEALKSLEEDPVMVEALGKEFVEWFVRVKRDVEITELKDFDKNKDDTYEIERDLYFSFV